MGEGIRSGPEQMMQEEDSLKKRYIYKLVTNIIGLVVNIITQAIIPRGLGPKSYGDFSFLSNFFMQVADFLDMGTSTGFYAKLSSRPREWALVTFYSYVVVGVVCGVAIFVVLATSTSLQGILWPGQDLFFIYLAGAWGGLNWIVMVLQKMTDAYGLTVSAEIARIGQMAVGLLLIIVLFATGHLNLPNFFSYHYLLFVLLAASLITLMTRGGFPLKLGQRMSRNQIAGYRREFFNYSHPLFVYGLFGLIVGIFDRWLLQYFGGSIEQGFFGLSYQVGALCFLFTGAMTPLLTREFSVAFGKQDLAGMASLFRRYIPLLYSVAAYFASFIAIQADRVVNIMGGGSFSHAAAAVAVMAFYPVHQTYGQLSGSVFFATGQTGLYRNIGVAFMLLGLPVTFFLIAPAPYLGLGAGATGLAIKMVLLQFLAVNVQLYFNVRFLNLPFWQFFSHQLFCLASLIGLSYLVSFGVDLVPFLQGRPMAGFFSAGLLYTLSVLLLVCLVPPLFGLRRVDISSFLVSLRRGVAGGAGH